MRITADDEPEWKVEKDVVEILLDRIFQIGYPHYGEMQNHMELNHLREALEEVIDGMVYTAMQILKLEKQIYEEKDPNDCSNESFFIQQGEVNNLESTLMDTANLTVRE